VIDAAQRTGWYVFGVTAGDDAQRVEVPEDIDLVAAGPLAAIVATVPLDEFGEDVLPDRLNDRTWLEEKARAHEAVLTAFAAAAPVVPFRFGTIYTSRDELVRALDERAGELSAALARVRGCWELGVKAWYAPQPSAPAEQAASGRAYLEQRRDARRDAAESAARRADVVVAAYERLLALAVDGVANRPQPRELTGRDEEMLLNAAFLVRRDDDSLAAEVARLRDDHADDGFTFELTGPWPPHNFVAGALDA
jgi:gas vesicle protein GvpL/GvpF